MESKNAVCYVVSGNYTKQLSVSLLSLVKSYLSDVALDVYVFNEQVAAEDLLVFRKVIGNGRQTSNSREITLVGGVAGGAYRKG